MALETATFVCKFIADPIGKQVKYVLNYKENTTNLETEVQKLTDLKQEVDGLVSSARLNAEDIKPSVDGWLEKADQTALAAHQLIQQGVELSKRRCFIGLCPNPVLRYQSSRKAFKQTVKITQVQTQGREFKEGSVSFPVSAVPSFPARVTLDKGFLHFNSRSKTWEEISQALKDPEVNVIGVYGMGGLGKTTLVKQGAARAVEEKLFDEVIMPVVTQKNVPTVQEYQEEMAKELGMRLDDQWTVSQRAARIFQRLTLKADEKKTLVILDDLRAILDLEQIGIPLGAECKILFTSKVMDVSYPDQKGFTLVFLEEGEGWTLFQKIARRVTDPAFVDVGKKVTRCCKGLPILIVTVAGALQRRKILAVWNNALISLQRGKSKEMQEFIDAALEFISFNHLSNAHKSLFLLCGLVGGGEMSIYHQLLKLGIGVGLFKDTKTVEEARNNLDTLIFDLKASFLLLDSPIFGNVRMHDVVRDVAIKIARNEDQNMLLGLSEEWPDHDMLRRCTALTFPYGIVPKLPECLESPSLEFLLLYHNYSSLNFTDNAFEKMQKLTVLDIRCIDLYPTLPSSLALLQNLQTLRLDYCKLGDISIVGSVKKLKILSLVYASIEKLPREIGDLSELRVLDLNGCSQLKVIPTGVIKRLSRLEELHMGKSFSEWEVEGLALNERSNASLDELNCLPKLSTLRIHIPDAKLLPKDFLFKKLERFTILIGDEEWDWEWHDEPTLYRSRGMKIKVNSSRDTHLVAGVKEMLRRTEVLYLEGVKNIHKLEWESFQKLKFVHIQHSAGTCYIVNATSYQTQDMAFLAALESMFLSHMSQLRTICVGRFMRESSFSKLKCVNVNSCRSLRNLFSFSMVIKCLGCLQKVDVTRCEALEAIVEDTREDGKNGDVVINELLEFHQLRSLSLNCLPKLVSFYDDMKNSSILQNRRKPGEINVTQMDEVSSVEGRTIDMPFFSEMVLFPKLEELTLSEIAYLPEIWRLPSIISFKNLTKLRVERCGGMKYLFTHSIAMCLEQLRFIRIERCELLKEIVAQVEGEETNETIKFPHLTFLRLGDLPCLASFCSESSIVLPTLECLVVINCKQFETFVRADTNEKLRTPMQPQPFFSEKVELPNLKILNIWKMDNVKTIWHDSLHEDSFFKLKQVNISACPNLLKIFPSTMLTRIQSLDSLVLRNNCLVEQVLDNSEMTNPTISQATVEFSQLSCLELVNLSSLKRFCSGSSVRFPALTKLKIVECKQFETFMYPFAVADSTRMSMGNGVEEMDSNGNLNPVMQPLFNEKVEFPSLKELELVNLESTTIWYDRIHENSFCRLQQLTIANCTKLLKLFPLAMLIRIQSLKKLRIEGCCLVEEVFDAPRLYMNEIIDVMGTAQLTNLYLKNLPKLECVWRNDLVQILSSSNLRKVDVHNCQSLKYLFPPSVAQQLYHLEKLFITDCGVKTIVCKKEEEVKDEVVAFVFPQLVTLWLEVVPKLESFYPRRHTIQWPSMKELSSVEILRLDPISREREGEKNFETIISKLEYLMTTREEARMLGRQGNLFRELFHNLKRLTLSDFNDESAVFPSEFLGGFHSVEALSLFDCSFEDIFPCEGSIAGEYSDCMVSLLDRLRHLRLCKLHKLKYILKEDPLLITTLGKLQFLAVEKCHGLTNIVPGSVSFKFLAVLVIWNCDGLVNLVQLSTAKSLVQLTTLKVTNCKMIKEIVASDSADIGAEDKIVFSKLKTLKLVGLPNLINFCPGNCVLKFPLLQSVKVVMCLNMKAFCGGITITPKLKAVSLTEQDLDFSSFDDLNTIIEKEAGRLADANATSSSNNYSEPEPQTCEITTEPSIEDEICENDHESRTKTATVKQDMRAQISEHPLKYGNGKKVGEINDKVTQPQDEAETGENAEKRGKEVVEIHDEATKPLVEAETSEKVNQSKTNDRNYKKVVEPGKEVHTDNKAGNEGSLAPTPDIVDVTCPSSQSHHALDIGIGATTCPQDNEFEGLQVAQHLVPLLKKARDKHGDFHISSLVKSKTVRIAAMESMGQVLHILQTQPPRDIDEEKIQFMEEAIHDLSLMRFHIEWLRPLIGRARKCLFCLEKEAKIDEMEVQLQVLKRELEMEKVSIDLDRPLLDI